MAAPREPGVMEEAPAEQSSAAAAAQDDQAAALEAAPEVMEEGPAAAVQEEAAGGGALVVEDEENVFLEDEEDWEYDGHGTHGPSPMGVAAASAPTKLTQTTKLNYPSLNARLRHARQLLF